MRGKLCEDTLLLYCNVDGGRGVAMVMQSFEERLAKCYRYRNFNFCKFISLYFTLLK